ncbi:MAG: carboxypeptidase-like regulatory domain-containing protein, partial [Gemmatimonadaceae bacterium]
MTMRTSLVMAAGAVLMAVATLPAQGERPSGLHEVDTRRIPAMRREISLDLRGVTLDAALQEIASRANLSLTYSLEVLPKRRTVSLSAEKIEVEQALREVLRDSGLDVVALSSGQVVVVRDRLRNRQPAHVVGVITGRVTDRTSGQPVVAAQVSVTGTTLGRITGEDGRYMIPNVPAGPVQVQARRIGYESQTQSVTVADGATATLDFVLTEAVAQLEQVVTTVTGNQRRAEIGNAIARIDADSTVRSAPVRDLGDLVNGRAAGVQVFFPNGVVGQAPRFRIRGVNSFTVRNDPLVIVDGVRVENSPGTLGAANLVALVFPQNTGRLADLNPEEIETIDIVKGPSAATLYGTDAANGVVLVTTKRGRAGEAAWTVYTEQGVSDVRADWPTNYFGWGRNTVTGAVQQCMLLALAAGQCRQDSVTTFNPMLDAPNSPLGTGHRQSYGLQVSGGATQLRYFFSGEFEDETGYLRLPDVEQEFLRQSRGG